MNLGDELRAARTRMRDSPRTAAAAAEGGMTDSNITSEDAEFVHQEGTGTPQHDPSKDSNLARQLRYQRGRAAVRHLAKYDVHSNGKLHTHKTLTDFVHLERFTQMRPRRVDPAFDILNGNLSETDCQRTALTHTCTSSSRQILTPT